MDPLAIKLLGEIRQQELLEQAAKGRQDTQRLLSQLGASRLDVWQEGDSALTSFYSPDGYPPFYRLRTFVAALLARMGGRAKRLSSPGIAQAEPQALAEPHCASECKMA